MTDTPASETLNEEIRLGRVRLFLASWQGTMLAVFSVTVGVLLLWNDATPLSTRLLWGGVLTLSYLVQAWAAQRLQRAPTLAQAVPRYMPWLLAALAAGSAGWGAVPWLLTDISTTTLVWISMFNTMLLFCVANAPGTQTMLGCAFVPVLVLNVLAFAVHGEAWLALAFAADVGLLYLYGLRVQRTVGTTLKERLVAQNLTEQLRQQQQLRLQVERENTRLLERQRLVHDVHDGLGSTLLVTLAAVEQGQLQPSAVAEALRACVTDLRLVIDSLEPMAQDLVTMLATIRFRLGPRLEAAGLTLDWSVQDLPPLMWLQPSDTLHVLRLVQEALANVLKHANARHVRVATLHRNGCVEIHIEDDGRGFDHSSVRAGRGLASQRQRARQLGGELQVDSAPGRGTTVRLRLPVEQGSMSQPADGSVL